MTTSLSSAEADPRSLSLSKGRGRLGRRGAGGGRKRTALDDSTERTIVSDSERRRPGTRFGMSLTHGETSQMQRLGASISPTNTAWRSSLTSS